MREIVADTLHNVVDPLVYDEAVTLIEEHKLAGRDIVIVSTSGTEVVEPIGAMLGADIVVASRLEEVDGKYTGDIDYYAYADEKARAVLELAEARGYDLEATATPTATRSPTSRCSRWSATPTWSTRTRSSARPPRPDGWPILVFTKPVTLRSRVPAKPTLAALAVGGVVAVGGVLWANARRSRLDA